VLEKAALNIEVPRSIPESGYSVKTRRPIVVLKHNDIEYTVQVGSVIRTESINPQSITKVEPRFLSTKQDKFRLAQMRQIAEYSANPMYAVSLDVDCVQVKPESVLVESYIMEQSKIIGKDFLPILEKL
jgi:hypothetical protein